MSKFSQWEKQLDAQFRAWFKDHVVTHQPTSIEGMEVYSWRKPDSYIDSIEYMIRGRYLICIGDQGDAVYEWSQGVSLEFLGGLDLDYFAGKCRASSCRSGFGPSGHEWNADKAFETACFHLDERGRELGGTVIEKKLAKVQMSIQDLQEACSGQHEWHQLLQTHGDELYGDWCELGGVGHTPGVRTRAHLIGLNMAREQMRQKAQVAA